MYKIYPNKALTRLRVSKYYSALQLLFPLPHSDLAENHLCNQYKV